MPTTHIDQFFIIDPYSGLPGGTAMTVQNYNYIDFDDNGWIETPTGDSVNGGDVTAVWHGDTITVNMGGSVVTITGVTFYVAGQPAVFTPTDGTILENATFISSTGVTSSTQVAISTLGPVCFTLGTLIDTIDGPRPIETLQVGDLIETLDNGPQPLLWIGRQKMSAKGEFAPIHFCKGAVGNNAALEVSPEHRMLITGWKAELYYGQDEVLVSAKHLVNGDTIYQKKGKEVEYFHLLFEDHEIVIAEGVPSESYLPGHAISRPERDVQAEILAIFPGVTKCEAENWKTARPVLKQHEALLLAA